MTPKDEEPSGWEEPSPQSISRKMDIDDGTSAWGDPNSYNYKNVNLWDKNSQGGPAPREPNLPTPMTGKSASGRQWLFSQVLMRIRNPKTRHFY